VKALRGLTLSIEAGQVFCLLGHNGTSALRTSSREYLPILRIFCDFFFLAGAGKTTTINILTGLFPPTAGDAFIYGHSVATEQDAIRRILGVCPQVQQH
jgi:ABC-type multidrug transport system ATPase subunit